MTYQELRKTLALVAAVSAIGFLAAFIERATELRRFAREAKEQVEAYEREINAQFKEPTNG